MEYPSHDVMKDFGCYKTSRIIQRDDKGYSDRIAGQMSVEKKWTIPPCERNFL